MKSIVLFKIRSGQANEVHNRLGQLQTVLECYTSFGRYDEAAIIQAENLEELWQIITCQIRSICGGVDVFPCLIEEGRSLKNPPEHVQEFIQISC
jgi:DNA-binding Lrp family transcriptional regulator